MVRNSWFPAMCNLGTISTALIASFPVNFKWAPLVFAVKLLSNRPLAYRVTIWRWPRAILNERVWHLYVGSSPPGVVACSKGWIVRPQKQYVRWVQNIVRQFGPYPVRVLEHWEDSSLAREDREECTSGVPVIVLTVKRFCLGVESLDICFIIESRDLDVYI